MPNQQVTVFHLSRMRAISEETFPKTMKAFLEHPQIVARGVQIGGNIKRMYDLASRDNGESPGGIAPALHST